MPDAFAQPLTWFSDPEYTVETPGFALHGNPLYLFRPAGPYHASLVVPAVGAARASIDEFRSIIATKPTTFPPVVPRYQFHEDQRVYGMAVAMTDAAETILYGFADQYMAAAARAAAGEPALSQEQDMRWWAMLQQAGGLAASSRRDAGAPRDVECDRAWNAAWPLLRDVTLYRQHISSQQFDFAVRNAAFYLGASGPWAAAESASAACPAA